MTNKRQKTDDKDEHHTSEQLIEQKTMTCERIKQVAVHKFRFQKLLSTARSNLINLTKIDFTTMKVKIAYSQANNVKDVITELKKQIGTTYDSKLIQFFSTTLHDPHEISKGLYDAFCHIPIFGCTTAGEMISGKMLEQSVVLMAYTSEIVDDCAIEVIENITEDKPHITNTFIKFEQYYKQSMSTLDPDQYVGFVLIDGMCGLEEKINERIGDLTNVTFIGGSAGDDMKFDKTYVFANGKAYTNAAVLALLKSSTEFDFLKTQSFVSTHNQITITKANESERTVFEINGEEATKEYAKILGINESAVDNYFIKHPVGLVFGDDFFVRGLLRTNKKGIIFACSIKEGMQLDILEAIDTVEKTQEDLDNKLKEFGPVSAIVSFNCLYRTLELKQKQQFHEYGKIFSDIPTIGFSTYGESYIGHINQTAVMVLFK